MKFGRIHLQFRFGLVGDRPTVSTDFFFVTQDTVVNVTKNRIKVFERVLCVGDRYERMV